MGTVRWTARHRGGAAFLLAFILVMVAVPAAALFGPRPAKFGWQMFAGAPAALSYGVVFSDGSVRDVDLADHLVNPRLDVPLEHVLPERLCMTIAEAEAVLIHRLIEDAEEIPCR